MSTPFSIRWAITLLVVAIVIVLSVLPAQARPGDSVFVWLAASTPKLVQKLMHLMLYAALAWLLTWSLESIKPVWLRLTIAFLLTVGMGAALEWYQTRVPGRFGTLLDVFLNTFGVIIGLIAAILLL